MLFLFHTQSATICLQEMTLRQSVCFCLILQGMKMTYRKCMIKQSCGKSGRVIAADTISTLCQLVNHLSVGQKCICRFPSDQSKKEKRFNTSLVVVFFFETII